MLLTDQPGRDGGGRDIKTIAQQSIRSGCAREVMNARSAGHVDGFARRI
jgi:hypothetical protein